MSTAKEILDDTRTHLNDEQSLLWTDVKLLPKLRVAQRELHLKLSLAGLPIVREVSSVITVTANSTDGVEVDLTAETGYPVDLIEPVMLKERAVGQLDKDFREMTERQWTPNLTKSTSLWFWCWRDNKIFVPGALVDVEVQIRYKKSLSLVTTMLDEVEPYQSELFLGYRTAALAYGNDPRAQQWNARADNALDDFLRFNIKGQQNMPVRQRGYHSTARMVRSRRY